MKTWLVAVALLAACTATPKYPVELPGIPLDVDPSIALITPSGGGHGCPVDGVVVTAAHVMCEKPGECGRASWSSRGYSGMAEVHRPSTYLDIVILTTYGGPVVDLPRGTVEVGDVVFWYEYDFRTRKNALRARRRFANILRIVAEHAVLDEVPVSGGSGSCVLNERGEVVGLITAAFDTDDEKGAGLVVLLPEFPKE